MDKFNFLFLGLCLFTLSCRIQTSQVYLESNQLQENLSSNRNYSNSSLSNSSLDKNQQIERKSVNKSKPIWIAGTYKGLKLGKSTEKDVKRIFGSPKYITNPEDEYDNPVESKLDYIYKNEPQIIIDKKTGIVTEIWGGDFSTFDEAIEKYRKDFYEIEFTEKGCNFKTYDETQNKKDRLNIAYPQYGFYFFLNPKNEVLAIYYTDKCE